MKKIKMIDLFAGCGGLTDGFMQTGIYDEIASVEWLKPQVDTLKNRLKNKWNKVDSNESVMRFDIQREEELYNGWINDIEFGDGKGLDYFVKKSNGIDIIIGGPPCQAYSVAGRVRDENSMKNDYRNYLFEHYLNVVNRYKPKLFVFENVPGILSAMPDGRLITDMIKEGFEKIGYTIIDDLRKYAKINASDYGVPQNRNRIIIIGINNSNVQEPQKILEDFYVNLLPRYKVKKKMTVREAISDLPKCFPLVNQTTKVSHNIPKCDITWHIPRYCNSRDMETFKTLAEDLESENPIYDSKKISELYEMKVGSKSPIHRYHVLNPDLPSTTIIAHLHKDGNRFIHYDSKQCRTITVREAARLQSFDDDFEFIGTQGSAYQMIGNAVPPALAKNIAKAVFDLIDKYKIL